MSSQKWNYRLLYYNFYKSWFIIIIWHVSIVAGCELPCLQDILIINLLQQFIAILDRRGVFCYHHQAKAIKTLEALPIKLKEATEE